MKRRRFWSGLALALLVALTAGAPIAPAQPASTLVVGLVAEPVALDPAQVTDLNSTRVGRRVVETLVAFADESTQIVPGLAESWTIARTGSPTPSSSARGSPSTTAPRSTPRR